MRDWRALLFLAAPVLGFASCGRGNDTPVDPAGVTMVAVGGSTPGSLPGGLPGSRPAGAGPASAPGSPLQTAVPAQAAPESGPPLIDPEVVAMMGQVDPVRLSDDVAHLVAFGTRHALSVADQRDRGVGAARDWIHGRFASFGGAADRQVVTEYEDFDLNLSGSHTTQRNVIATLPGRDRPKRFVYLTAHYDSRTEDIADAGSLAPGADDDASGVATLLEAARILSQRPWGAGIRFAALAAEEPGLYGSRHHAKGGKEVGLPIQAVLHNEVVGGDTASDGTVDAGHFAVLAAGKDDGPSIRLARYIAVIADRYAGPGPLINPVALSPSGDEFSHESFSDAGFAAVRIAAAARDETRLHNDRDTQDRLNSEYHAAITRLNVAVAASLAQAPPSVEDAPTVRQAATGLEVTWAPVQHPAVAGYWVAFRRNGDQSYSGWQWVGAPALAGVTAPGSSVSVVTAGEPLQTVVDPGPAGPDGVRVVVATADVGGHMSLFSPEGKP